MHRLMRCKMKSIEKAGLDPDEGGVNVPDGGDGITRIPSVDGTISNRPR